MPKTRPSGSTPRRAAGARRIVHAALLDNEVRPHNERFRAAAQVGSGNRVLDIGCGTGQSTREAARAASGGSALGVDLSAQAVDLARQLSEREGLRNVTYLQADAQVHRFPPRHFDLCISRFGTMFFADPAAAFSNIGTALRPGGRLVMLVWQGRDRNVWSTAIRQAIVGPDALRPDQPGPGPIRSRSATRPWPGASWRRPASPRSVSPTWTSRSTTARTRPWPTT